MNSTQKSDNPFSEEFYESVRDELFNNILPYWQRHARDTSPETPGFFGAIDNANTPDSKIQRSIVMTSRFLWTYSAVARLTKNPAHLELADFAYDVITKKYWDAAHGGVFWSVHPDGSPCVSKKQIYGEAFCCYGLSEYAAALKELRENEEGKAFPSLQTAGQSSATPSPRGNPPKTPASLASQDAMNLALDIYNLLEKYALDKNQGGYVEARDVDWSETSDMILSPKDMNCPKSMNTNLHVMEAYTNLYRTLPVVFPDSSSIRAEVGESLTNLVRVSVGKILQPDAHLGMFFDMDWNLLADEVSYGHDIEASWLLWEAACERGDDALQSEIRDTVIRVAQVSLDEGFDHKDGCMENFLRDGGKVRDRTRVWWNQAEAVNGFLNAWEMTGDEKYADAVIRQWDWIRNHQVDKNGGEWWGALDISRKPILDENKGGNWKTSYHNGRTCMEVLRRGGRF